MGFYRDHVLPRLVDCGMRGEDFGEERRQALAGVHGRVLEIGFGSGLNLPHYPAEVRELVALDPALVGRRLAADRLTAARFPVRFAGTDAQELPLEEASFDAAVSTWTLCTVPDPARALAEIRRVLVPGGTLHFLEHGRSSEAPVARWQDRLTPLQKRLFGGCHLNRAIDELVAASGLALELDERRTMKGPRIYTYLYRGIARRR